ncbi:Cyclin-dependent kinase 3 [Colletotrichum sidae]|uniref:Cyclin-dependent kinase 3 n=1 Tax=Colletotrichum sidae TaxID=1347389 RepID=A0A4R8T347_9PEZI|nr:Cyclin-dependent kinase 3 [Colletotrichum sidae]
MVWIHPDHHNFDIPGLDSKRGFAIKRLEDQKDQTADIFKQEVDMLKKFTGEGAHDHVVSVLATYKQHGQFHLIFHRADADLFHYWKTICPNPVMDYDTVLWIAKQLEGLSDGLLRFHKRYTSLRRRCEAHADPEDVEPHSTVRGCRSEQRQNFKCGDCDGVMKATREERFGRHGDLKPENLLWFSDPNNPIDKKGTIKITDFGQAELHSVGSKSYRRTNGIDTLTYRSPECEIQPLVIRQSSDVWSLGCIFLEFVTWALGGSKLVQDFKKKRMLYDARMRMDTDIFFELVMVPELRHCGAKLKLAVSRPLPIPLAPTAVLIKVHAVALNYRNANIANSGNPWPVPLPSLHKRRCVLGTDAAGGKIKLSKVGDLVSLVTDTELITGREPVRSWIAADEGGMLADLVAFHEHLLAKVHEHPDCINCAILPYAGATAWYRGISMFAFKLAQAAGLKVVLSSPSDNKIKKVQDSFPSAPIYGVVYKTYAD